MRSLGAGCLRLILSRERTELAAHVWSIFPSTVRFLFFFFSSSRTEDVRQVLTHVDLIEKLLNYNTLERRVADGGAGN